MKVSFKSALATLKKVAAIILIVVDAGEKLAKL